MGTEQASDLEAIKTIERVAVFFCIACVGVAVYKWPSLSVIGGIVSGALIGILNFRFLKRLVVKLVDESTKGKTKYGAMFFVKILLLAGLAGFVILGLKFDPIAFMVGFAAIIFGIFFEGVKSMFI